MRKRGERQGIIGNRTNLVATVSEKERRLNEVLTMMFRVVNAHPLVQRLPKPFGGCE